ncbi:unnamed protein product, partial [Owenia fusiformis]
LTCLLKYKIENIAVKHGTDKEIFGFSHVCSDSYNKYCFDNDSLDKLNSTCERKSVRRKCNIREGNSYTPCNGRKCYIFNYGLAYKPCNETEPLARLITYDCVPLPSTKWTQTVDFYGFQAVGKMHIFFQWLGHPWRRGYTWGIATAHGDPIEEVTRQIACDKLSLSLGLQRNEISVFANPEHWDLKCSPIAKHVHDCKIRDKKGGNYWSDIKHQRIQCNKSNSAVDDRFGPCRRIHPDRNKEHTVCGYGQKDPDPPVDLCCRCWMFFEDPFSYEIMPLGSMSKAARTACGFK